MSVAMKTNTKSSVNVNLILAGIMRSYRFVRGSYEKGFLDALDEVTNYPISGVDVIVDEIKMRYTYDTIKGTHRQGFLNAIRVLAEVLSVESNQFEELSNMLSA